MSSLLRSRRFWIAAGVGVVVLAGLGVGAYLLWPRPLQLPGPDSPTYREYAEDFLVGLAALDTEQVAGDRR